MNRFWKSGDPFIWLTGGALALALLMVTGLLLLILANGLGHFWPAAVMQATLSDGREILGQITDREVIPVFDEGAAAAQRHRIQIQRGNRDLYGTDFVWVDEADLRESSFPPDVIVIERREWGKFYGFLKAAKDGEISRAPDWKSVQQQIHKAQRLVQKIYRIEKKEIGAINFAQERTRLRLKRLSLKGIADGPDVDALQRQMGVLQERYREREAELATLRAGLTVSLQCRAAGNRDVEIPLGQVVRMYRPNDMTLPAKMRFYAAKLWEFVSDDPRESNTEGGVFPAIFGTVMMVFIMSIIVTPLGVLAAFYLREYAKQGTMVSIVRIAVNNLAGVPSIVFGVFGVGFFIYFIGGSIDRLFYAESLPTPTFGTGGILWASLTLALLTVPVVIVATEEGLAAIPGGIREASLALGATKFETTWRVVLPAVMPAILTGLILAMARAAGEVAPLMITGVVKLAPALPLDGLAPFLHLDRKFMHLGFHIYDVGFQSPNVDAARPMVYTTTFLLILIVLVLNITAILLRNRLRRKYAVSML